LNIDYTGLSIWEGGLRAYSDKASSLDSQGNPVNPIYGYEKKNYNSPLPYFNLVDDINGNELNSRVVMHKGHFFEVEKTTDGFQTH
jgi:hypothetical protein